MAGPDGPVRPDAAAAAAGPLREVGLKVTPPRVRVLTQLQQLPRRHWSADELHQTLADEGEAVGLATIYRVLSQLAQAGVVRRSSFDATGKAVFEIDDGPHHDHLVCVRCGRVDEFVDAAIEARQQHIVAERGFRLVEHRLALFGLCRGCQPLHKG